MAIKITDFGGTDWIDGEILTSQDLINTIIYANNIWGSMAITGTGGTISATNQGMVNIKCGVGTYNSSLSISQGGYIEFYGAPSQGGSVTEGHYARIGLGDSIYFEVIRTGGNIVYRFVGAGETTNSDTNFTTSTALRIEWDITEVRFYVDGVLKATHTSSVPTGNLLFSISGNNSVCNATINFNKKHFLVGEL